MGRSYRIMSHITYSTALCLTALVVLAGQIVMWRVTEAVKGDSQLINVAGDQSTLAKRTCIFTQVNTGLCKVCVHSREELDGSFHRVVSTIAPHVSADGKGEKEARIRFDITVTRAYGIGTYGQVVSFEVQPGGDYYACAITSRRG
jgi:hypothetical protein